MKAPPEVVIVDPETMTEITRWREVGRDAGVACYIALGEGYVAYGGHDRIQIHASNDGSLVASVPLTRNLEQLRFSARTMLLYAANQGGSIDAWDLTTFEANKSVHRHHFSGHAGKALSVDIPSNGDWLASGGRDGAVRIWNDPKQGRFSDIYLRERIEELQFSPCGRYLAILKTSPDNTSMLRIIDFRSGDARCEVEVPSLLTEFRRESRIDLRFIFTFHPTGDYFTAVNKEGLLAEYESATGRVHQSIRTEAEGLRHLINSPDGESLIYSEAQRLIITSRMPPRMPITLSTTHECLGFVKTQQGDYYLDLDSRRICVYRDASKKTLICMLSQMFDRPSCAVVSPDGSRIAALAFGGREIYFWHLNRPNSPTRLIGHQASLRGLSISSDGNTLFSHDVMGNVKLWHLPTRSALMTLGSSEERIHCYAIHPSSEFFVMCIEKGGRFLFRSHPMGLSQGDVSLPTDLIAPST